MTSQIPFTPLTPEAMERLTLDEALAFEAATVAVAGDQKPLLEVVATLVLAIQRLITGAAPDAAAADQAVRDRMAAMEEAIRSAERERIAQLADLVGAIYDDDGDGVPDPFADLIREPRERSDDKEGPRS